VLVLLMLAPQPEDQKAAHQQQPAQTTAPPLPLPG
jgi:hypothetical protein